MADKDETQMREMPYVVFKLQDSQYAISSGAVLYIGVLGEVTPMVGAEENCRGFIIFHGDTVPVYDLKKMFGMGDRAAELQALMNERIADHDRWVSALEKSVEDGTEFTLTTDPHMCAFGKWYDNFHTDNNYLDLFLKSVNAPHKAIHKTGETVKALIAEGKKEEARRAVDEMKRTHYAKTHNLLVDVGKAYKEGQNEMLIILQLGDARQGIVVDSVSNIRTPGDVCDPPRNMPKGACRYIVGIAKEKGEGGEEEIIQLLDAQSLME